MELPPIIGFFQGVIGHLSLIDFITNPRLRKGHFSKSNVDGKKILILRSGSLVTCGEGIRHPTMQVQEQSFV